MQQGDPARANGAGQHHEPVAQGGGSARQHDRLPVPSAPDPRKERGKTGGHSEGVALRTGRARGRDLLGAEHCKHGRHRHAASRSGGRDPAHPPRAHRRRRSAAVGCGA